MSIPILVKEAIVGNSKVCWVYIFAEERKNLFPKSLIGATIQDSGTKERKNMIKINTDVNNKKMKINK